MKWRIITAGVLVFLTTITALSLVLGGVNKKEVKLITLNNQKGLSKQDARNISISPVQRQIASNSITSKPLSKTKQVLQANTSDTSTHRPGVETVTSNRLQIPRLGINASIESVGLDDQGRMDVPSNFSNVGLYNLGYKPGDNGSAVISGHYDTVSGSAAVFYRLAELVAGDEIIIIDEKNEKLTFVVSEVQSYPHDQMPLNRIFATSGRPGLNLITCAGSWDTATNNYSDRIVVYAVK